MAFSRRLMKVGSLLSAHQASYSAASACWRSRAAIVALPWLIAKARLARLDLQNTYASTAAFQDLMSAGIIEAIGNEVMHDHSRVLPSVIGGGWVLGVMTCSKCCRTSPPGWMGTRLCGATELYPLMDLTNH